MILEHHGETMCELAITMCQGISYFRSLFGLKVFARYSSGGTLQIVFTTVISNTRFQLNREVNGVK